MAQQPVAASAHVIDGPSADIVRPAGIAMSIARDGTGGLVYLKQVAGVQHVFVSTLSGGAFGPPVQVDPGLGASSQPVIAAGNDGLLLVAFVSGGELYVADRSTSASAFAPPAPLASGAANPAISIANTGKAYLAYHRVERRRRRRPGGLLQHAGVGRRSDDAQRVGHRRRGDGCGAAGGRGGG